MNFQQIVVIAIVFVAVVFAGGKLFGKRRSFSNKNKCGDDCGCNGGGK